MENLQNYIGGQLCAARSGKWLDNVSPANGAVYSRIPASDAQDVAAAVEAAEGAFPAWSGCKAEDRAQFLLRMADLIEEQSEAFSMAESRDSGKPLALARRMDIPRARDNFRFFAAAAQCADAGH